MSDLGAFLIFLGVFFGAVLSICSILLMVQTFALLSVVKQWLRVRVAAESMKLSERQREASMRTDF